MHEGPWTFFFLIICAKVKKKTEDKGSGDVERSVKR